MAFFWHRSPKLRREAVRALWGVDPIRSFIDGENNREQLLATVLPSEPLADGFQFPPAFRGGLGIGQLKFIKRIQDNLGNNQPGILLVIGGNDVDRKST